MIQRRSAAAVVAVVVLALAVPAAAVLGSSSTRPSRAGHPGHAVAIGEGGLSISGPVGTLVHVHLARPLAVPDTYDRDERYALSGTDDWAGLLLAAETQDDTNNLALVTTSQSITCQGPCPERTFSTVAFSFVSNLPAGDYALTLAGPPGARITATLHGNDPTLPPTRITAGYPMPYVSGRAADVHGSAPHRGGYGGVAAPAVGRRTLGVVVLGVHERGRGTNVQVKYCVGGYLRPSSTDALGDTVQRSCYGGGYGESSGIAYPVTGAVEVHPTGFALIGAVAGTGTFEINNGGGWSATCDDEQCTFDGRAFSVALDS